MYRCFKIATHTLCLRAMGHTYITCRSTKATREARLEVYSALDVLVHS